MRLSQDKGVAGELLRQSYIYLACLAAALSVLQLSYVFQKIHTNHKENEHVENLVYDVGAALRRDLVFRTAVLQCSILHREAATQNPEICRCWQVHGCCKADVTQA